MTESVLISVVIPAYNEASCIGRCLRSLARQVTRFAFEVIVVDNDSTDGTAAVAASYPGVRVVFEPCKGIVPARQAGQRAARGTIVAHTDADSELPANWIESIGRAFEAQPGLVLVSGAMSYQAGPRRACVLQRILNALVLAWWFLTRRLAVVNGCNFAVRATALQRAGGFAVALPETGDSRVLSLLRPQGRVALLRGAVVRTSARRFVDQGVLRAYLFYFLEQLGSLLGIRLEQNMNAPDVRLLETAATTRSRSRRLLKALPILPVLAVAGGCTYLAINPTSQVYGRIVLHGPRTDKVIALTFDDGPNEPYTSEILDVLDRYGIKGTFFEVGTNVEYYPQTTERIVEEGHVVANHSYDHSRLATAVDLRYSEVDRAQAVFKLVAGVEPALFRPPAGIHTPWQMRRVGGQRMVTVNWDAEGMDWQKDATADSITNRVLSEAKPGSIVLLHDGDESYHGSSRSETVDALPSIIEGLEARGYHFVTVPQLLHVPAYLPDNDGP
jgi:peptidoglycan-N-acetylglucosamine deacetylase